MFRSLTTLFSFCILLFPAISAAKNIYLPLNSEVTSHLDMKNSGDEDEPFWIQYRIPDTKELKELQFITEANSETSIELNNAFDHTEWILIKTRPTTKLEAYYSVTQDKLTRTVKLQEANRNVHIFNSTEGGVLQIANLSELDNKIQVIYKNLFEEYTEDYLLPAFAVKTIPLKNVLSTELQIHSEYRSTSLFSGEQVLQSRAGNPLALSPAQEPVYFLVSNRTGGDQSFVLGLTDPTQIALARDQIKNPKQFPKVVTAQIQLGYAQHNRNLLIEGSPTWSWSVSKFYGFTEMAPQSCDGSPQMLEERVSEWIDYVGEICFWSYSITRELSHSEVAGTH